MLSEANRIKGFLLKSSYDPGKIEKSRYFLEEALRLNPDNEEAKKDYISYLYEKGEYTTDKDAAMRRVKEVKERKLQR